MNNADKQLRLMREAIMILCRNVRPDGYLRYFDWEDRCRMKDIYKLLSEEDFWDFGKERKDW